MIGETAKIVLDAVSGVLPKRGAANSHPELSGALPERVSGHSVVSNPNAEHHKFVAAQLPFILKDVNDREVDQEEVDLEAQGLDSLQREVSDRLSTLKVSRGFIKGVKISQNRVLSNSMSHSYSTLYSVIKMLAPFFSRLRNFVSSFRLSSNMKQ